MLARFALQARQQVQDLRAALIMLLIARCSSDPTALQLVGGEVFIGHLLQDADARICYHASLFLQQRVTVSCPDQYRKALRHLTQQAQLHSDQNLLRNPFLQMSTMLDLSLINLHAL